MNINDPAGVKALLDQLRSSQAWRETLVVPTDADLPSDVPTGNSIVDGNSQATSSSCSTSVATLLSQLQSSSSWRSPSSPGHTESPQSPVDPPIRKLATPVPSQQNVKTFTFQQALPYLVQLSEDSNLVRSITQIKQQQADLERQLWDERQGIQKKYDERVKVARMKANMIGTVLTKHEADALTHAFQAELRKFDAERVLPAWDALVIKQQAALAGAGIPTMFITNVAKDRERQQKVIQVLEGITG